MVIAKNNDELEGLFELKKRGDKNSVNLKLIDIKELNEIEPNAKTFEKALFSPTTSSIEPKMVCNHIALNFSKKVDILFKRSFLKKNKNSILTNKEKINYKYMFNAGGLYADKIAHLYGEGLNYTVLPFKGINLEYNDNDLLKMHVYPVPNLINPFLGVYFTKTVNDHVKIGPTAIPAFWGENYDFKNIFRLNELINIVLWQSKLFLLNSFNFRNIAFEEVKKYNRIFFINESKELLKNLKQIILVDIQSQV